MQTRGSAIAERPAQRSVSVENKCCLSVVRIAQTDRVYAWGALSATATFYSATYIVLQALLQ